MVPASATFIVGPLIVVTASSAGAVSTTSRLTSIDIRIFRTPSTRDGDVLWFLVLHHGNSCFTDSWMYTLLHLTNKTPLVIDDVALLDSMFVLVWF